MSYQGETQTGKYRVMVIADSSGKFAGNQLRFDTIENAKLYGADLAWRWISVREWAVFDADSDERVTEPVKV